VPKTLVIGCGREAGCRGTRSDESRWQSGQKQFNEIGRRRRTGLGSTRRERRRENNHGQPKTRGRSGSKRTSNTRAWEQGHPLHRLHPKAPDTQRGKPLRTLEKNLPPEATENKKSREPKALTPRKKKKIMERGDYDGQPQAARRRLKPRKHAIDWGRKMQPAGT